MYNSKLSASRLLFPLGAGLLLFGCGGGGSGGGGGGEGFQVLDVNVPDNSVWALNRAIVIKFSQPVNFASVSLSTINIREINGAPSAGEFSVVPGDPASISFQPVCPRLPDYSDAGFLPGGVAYEIRIVGAETGTGITVKSTSNASLSLSEYRTFTTPNSTNPSVERVK